MKRTLLDSSSITLLVSNIIVIFLAIVQKWDVSEVLWVYWMQSVIIGFFQFLRILSLRNFSTENFTINNKPVLPTNGTKIFTAFFFLFHYGFFHLIYAILIFNFFIPGQPFDFTYIFLGGFIFFINHSFSYFHNRIKEAQKIQNLGQLMFSPYLRIIPMHLIIIFGTFFGQASLTIFLTLKTLADLLMHIFKHREIEYAK